MHVPEKTNILLSVSSNYFLLYFDICLNIQRFVYSEFCKYRLGLRRNKHVLTKCNSCLPAIQWFYIQHSPSFYPISKLDLYLSVSRVSKIFTSGPLLYWKQQQQQKQHQTYISMYWIPLLYKSGVRKDLQYECVFTWCSLNSCPFFFFFFFYFFIPLQSIVCVFILIVVYNCLRLRHLFLSW